MLSDEQKKIWDRKKHHPMMGPGGHHGMHGPKRHGMMRMERDEDEDIEIMEGAGMPGPMIKKRVRVEKF